MRPCRRLNSRFPSPRRRAGRSARGNGQSNGLRTRDGLRDDRGPGLVRSRRNPQMGEAAPAAQPSCPDLHAWFQQSLRRCGVPFRPDRARLPSGRRANPAHLASTAVGFQAGAAEQRQATAPFGCSIRVSERGPASLMHLNAALREAVRMGSAIRGALLPSIRWLPWTVCRPAKLCPASLSSIWT